ncbi:hypothetical protein [Nitrosopumilus oxyclinae]|uniref:hypothetical protein n=1 Tax=Nitrosopumilus oxyclinae TaxID=1959104 RepID=UPI0015CD75F1|nr:hypothetical protein [Nitrosopumilus oxyclinae]
MKTLWHYIKKNDRPFMPESANNAMRSIRECRHCGREFYSMKDEFCSFDCVTQTS